MGELHDFGASVIRPLGLPRLNPTTAPFWEGGATGRLMVARCEKCEKFFHPPSPICPSCRCRDTGFAAVSGNAIIDALTIDRQAANVSGEPAPVIAVVLLPEPGEVRLLTRIVCDTPEEAVIGMAVTVRFEQHGDVYLPLFAPAAA